MAWRGEEGIGSRGAGGGVFRHNYRDHEFSLTFTNKLAHERLYCGSVHL